MTEINERAEASEPLEKEKIAKKLSEIRIYLAKKKFFERIGAIIHIPNFTGRFKGLNIERSNGEVILTYGEYDATCLTIGEGCTKSVLERDKKTLSFSESAYSLGEVAEELDMSDFEMICSLYFPESTYTELWECIPPAVDLNEKMTSLMTKARVKFREERSVWRYQKLVLTKREVI